MPSRRPRGHLRATLCKLKTCMSRCAEIEAAFLQVLQMLERKDNARQATHEKLQATHEKLQATHEKLHTSGFLATMQGNQDQPDLSYKIVEALQETIIKLHQDQAKCWDLRLQSLDELQRYRTLANVARDMHMTQLRENGACHYKGALEMIHSMLSEQGFFYGMSPWAVAFTTNSEFSRCVKNLLGEDVSTKQVVEYIEANLTKPLRNHVPRRPSFLDIAENGGVMILPDLPPKDKALLKCILQSYNFSVADQKKV